MEDILYNHLRCSLVHEAELHQDVKFTETCVVDGKAMTRLIVGKPNEIPDVWVLHLIEAIIDASENEGLFGKDGHI